MGIAVIKRPECLVVHPALAPQDGQQCTRFGDEADGFLHKIPADPAVLPRQAVGNSGGDLLGGNDQFRFLQIHEDDVCLLPEFVFVKIDHSYGHRETVLTAWQSPVCMRYTLTTQVCNLSSEYIPI